MYAIIENGSKQYKVSVGDVVKVAVLDVDQKRGRFSLTMKGVK